MEPISNLHNVIARLSGNILEAMEAKFQRPRTYSAGEFLFQSGDKSDAFYQLISGEMNVGNYSPDGKELILVKLQPGDCVGEGGAIDGLPRPVHVIAITEAVVRSMPREDFLSLYRQYPEISHQLLLMATQRTRMLINLLSDAILLTLRQRVVRSIQEMYISQSSRSGDGQVYIEISHEEMGNKISASRQSTSKELKYLENQGVINIRYGRIYIADLELLNKMAASLSSYVSIAPLYGERGQ